MNARDLLERFAVPAIIAAGIIAPPLLLGAFGW